MDLRDDETGMFGVTARRRWAMAAVALVIVGACTSKSPHGTDNTGLGDVLAVARVAGIMAAKKTPELIPLCHPIMLTSVKVDFAFQEWGIEIEARAKTMGPTGVEMEALTAVSVAALTIYDMLKAVERGARIEGIRLVRKEGGKSGVWTSET